MSPGDSGRPRTILLNPQRTFGQGILRPHGPTLRAQKPSMMAATCNQEAEIGRLTA
jgi:hypothetical protein